MAIKALFGWERFHAFVAFKGLFARVQPDMGIQIAGKGEGTPADVALVRLLARMHQHMLLVAGLLGQANTTDLARERLLARVTNLVLAQR